MHVTFGIFFFNNYQLSWIVGANESTEASFSRVRGCMFNMALRTLKRSIDFFVSSYVWLFIKQVVISLPLKYFAIRTYQDIALYVLKLYLLEQNTNFTLIESKVVNNFPHACTHCCQNDWKCVWILNSLRLAHMNLQRRMSIRLE